MIDAIQYFNDKSQHVCRVLALWSRKTFEESNVVDTNVGEVWKWVPGYEGLYEVSSVGRIRSAKKILAQMKVTKKRGPSIRLYKERTKKYFLVSRLVLMAFFGMPPTPKHHAAHNNGDRLDNRPENLRWATAKENESDKIVHGTYQFGEKNPSAKLTNQNVLEIYRLKNIERAVSIARRYGVAPSVVSKIFSGDRWATITGEGLVSQ